MGWVKTSRVELNHAVEIKHNSLWQLRATSWFNDDPKHLLWLCMHTVFSVQRGITINLSGAKVKIVDIKKRKKSKYHKEFAKFVQLWTTRGLDNLIIWPLVFLTPSDLFRAMLHISKICAITMVSSMLSDRCVQKEDQGYNKLELSHKGPVCTI